MVGWSYPRHCGLFLFPEAHPYIGSLLSLPDSLVVEEEIHEVVTRLDGSEMTSMLWMHPKPGE